MATFNKRARGGDKQRKGAIIEEGISRERGEKESSEEERGLGGVGNIGGVGLGERDWKEGVPQWYLDQKLMGGY
jgi:hypothetical protein